jgi:hypothetical protein
VIHVISLPLTTSDAEIIEAIEIWVRALSEARNDDAWHLLNWPSWCREWSAEVIGKLTRNHGSLEPIKDRQEFHVSDPEHAIGTPRHRVTRFPETSDQIVGHVCYDLPLNGEWSQLTATFEICRQQDMLTLVLEDIHVL